jgi:hypothetical protein
MTTIAGNPASIIRGELPPVVADKDKFSKAYVVSLNYSILNAYQFHKDSGPRRFGVEVKPNRPTLKCSPIALQSNAADNFLGEIWRYFCVCFCIHASQ